MNKEPQVCHVHLIIIFFWGIAVAMRWSPCLTVAGWENGKPSLSLHTGLANGERSFPQSFWPGSFPWSFWVNANMYLAGHAGLHTLQALTQVAVVPPNTEHSRWSWWQGDISHVVLNSRIILQSQKPWVQLHLKESLQIGPVKTGC